MKSLLLLLTSLTLLIPQVLAWGADGHKIVATIAQVHLHPNTKKALLNILPPEAKGHLAFVAAWADQVRARFPATGPMHYINPKEDHPGQTCSFGEHGWTNDKVNVITAIQEKTYALLNGTRDRADDETLRFLVHFIGDMHNPLHLTGYLRGGNDAWVKWFGRRQKLHSVWDSSILFNKIATLGNYTTPTRSAQLEGALRGDIYDPYVRFIVKEGVWGWWREESKGWFDCPAQGDGFPRNEHDLQVSQVVHGYLPAVVKSFMYRLNLLQPHLPLAQTSEPYSPACPYTWSKSLHPFNCRYIWPPAFDPHGPAVELDEGDYLIKIREDKVMERLMGMGGIRLAAVLNAIYAQGEEAVWVDGKKRLGVDE